jgi:hypothetical protein
VNSFHVLCNVSFVVGSPVRFSGVDDDVFSVFAMLNLKQSSYTVQLLLSNNNVINNNFYIGLFS